jgi:hypothetical protein
MSENKSTKTEEFQINGDEIVKKVKEIIKAGNARKVTIKSVDGKELLSFPLTVGVAGGVLGLAFAAPLVAVGAIAGIVTKCTLVVEKK